MEFLAGRVIFEVLGNGVPGLTYVIVVSKQL